MEQWIQEVEEMGTNEEYSPSQSWSDRIYDYEAAGNTDSSDAKTGKLMRHYETAGQYGTIREERIQRVEEIVLGSLHKVCAGESVPELCLRYAVDEHALRAKNSSLLSRCAVDDHDLGDLAVAVIPRNLEKHDKHLKHARPLWQIAMSDTIDAPLLYEDDWVAVCATAIIVKDLFKSRHGTHTAAIPLKDVAMVRQVTRNGVNAASIVPWAATSATSTGYLFFFAIFFFCDKLLE